MNRKLRARRDRAEMARRALVKGGYLSDGQCLKDLVPIGGDKPVNIARAADPGAAVLASVDAAETPPAVREYRDVIASLLADLIYLAEKEGLGIPDGFLSRAATDARNLIVEEVGQGQVWTFASP